jgi:PadR family transcriptional regulator PadR
MYDKSQLNRGTLEGCILRIIQDEEIYGYDILRKLLEYGFEDISEGTIYPLLLRLEKKAMITAKKKASPLGPKRKYYTITETGEQAMELFEVHWQKVQEAVGRILRSGGVK